MQRSGENNGSGRGAMDLVDRLREAFERAAERGVRLSAGGSQLELQHFGDFGSPDDGASYERKDSVEAFEESPVTARHPGEPQGESRLVYFLDGVQSAEEIGRVGTVPIVLTTVAAAVVERRERRLHRMELSGAPNVVQALVLPQKTDDPEAQVLFQSAQEAGLPLVSGEAEELPEEAGLLLIDSTHYEPEVDPADYAGLKQRAYVRVRSLRESLERHLLGRWSEERPKDDDGWIAVDGQLPLGVENAVGLIKSSGKLFFGGEEARMLIDLQTGHRTTAFVPPWQKERAAAGHSEDERASWYLRAWPVPEGSDAMEGLMRLEIQRKLKGIDPTPEEMDEVSRWVLAERVPLAKPDPRWASMIYPVHYVEKILKPMVRDQRRTRARLERTISEIQSPTPQGG